MFYFVFLAVLFLKNTHKPPYVIGDCAEQNGFIYFQKITAAIEQ